MKLEPIFVVAPDPTLPSMSSRRAFVGMGIAFALGGAVGSACGYSVGVATTEKAEDDSPAQADPQPSGDADLDELRRLSIKAPIDELMQNCRWLMVSMARTYRADEILWKGFERVCDHLLENEKFPDRRITSRWAAQIIQDADEPFSSRYRHRCPALNQVK